jgi:hypothetical protein
MSLSKITIEAQDTGEISLKIENLPQRLAIQLLTEAATHLTLQQDDLPEDLRAELVKVAEGSHSHVGHGCSLDPTLSTADSSDEPVIAPSFGELGGLSRSLRRQRELADELEKVDG